MKKIITIILMISLVLSIVGCTTTIEEKEEKVLTLDDVKLNYAYSRAKEAVLWSQPLMGVAISLDAIRTHDGDYNDIVYLSRPGNWKWRILTPNSVSLYMESVIKTSPNEPVVVEIPPVTAKTDLFGTIMDSFQAPLVDVGSSGIDGGKGGKYIILPVSYDGVVPEGFIPVHTERHISFFNFRVIPVSFSESDLAEANQFIQQINVYPLNDPENKGKHIDVYDKIYRILGPDDSTHFDIMTDLLNQETVVERDLVMMSMMKSFGYNHGEEFDPSVETREMLSKAVSSARDDLVLMIRDIAAPWWEGNPAWMQPGKPVGWLSEFKYVTEEEYAIDARAETFGVACCLPKELGFATAYIFATRDVDGVPLDTQLSYKLHVPANVPVNQFWSLTAYDARSAAFIENVAVTDISSLDEGIQYNDDGSIDLYVGPKAPEGKASNWIETKGDNNAVYLFRFYGPKAGVKDGSWVMDGFERVEEIE